MQTPKQEKLIKLIIENLGIKGNTKTKGEMLLEAGYSEVQSKNPQEIFGSLNIQEGLTDVVSELEKKRESALNALTTEKIEQEKAKDLTDIIDKLTKNIQLLGGKPTEITKNELSELSDEQLNKIANGKSGTGEEGISEKTS